MTRTFAETYERTATRITAPISFAAIERLLPLRRGVRLLDIGAGTGAFSIPAAHSGASVTAVDVAPGMIELLSARLAPFPDAEARLMDGEALSFADGAFDVAVSMIGVSTFSDWRRGLAEQARVVRSGGRTVLATWRTPPGGGPFVIMAEAIRAVFPDRPPPAVSEGFAVLADPARMDRAMRDAGLNDVEVTQIEAAWQGPGGRAYLDELRDLHAYLPAYAALQADERARVDDAILSIIDRRTTEGKVVVEAWVVLGFGTKA